MGMNLGSIVGGVIGIVGSLFGGSEDSDAAEKQLEWGKYNAEMQRLAAMSTLQAQGILTESNIAIGTMVAEEKARLIEEATSYNVSMMQNTLAYNDVLFENDLSLIWEQSGLELAQMEVYREKERGSMIAAQSSSGTVIGVGSNADVVVDQRAQEAMDAFVIKRGADLNAKRVQDARAVSMWEGEQKLKQIQWEGDISAKNTRRNASINAMSARFTQKINTISGTVNAKVGYASNMSSAYSQYNANMAQASSSTSGGILGGITGIISGIFS